ncbi:hypothetical protein HPP92_006848 [Vanilla planifolia]|uniref:Uncharacterized protein n=1 Tax=Vanilla planifolia TaxID=51239 RepID=A0A835VAP5_VANPL|nr:hypothetical protein HPP92_006848 [Vanilla planifolia]
MAWSKAGLTAHRSTRYEVDATGCCGVGQQESRLSCDQQTPRIDPAPSSTPKLGGKFRPRLNNCERPIANKYREGKMKRTLKRESKSA